MNYQPFFDMNILVSDSMIQWLHDYRLPLIVLATLTLFLFYIVVSLIEWLFRFMFKKKVRPYAVGGDW